MSGKSLRYSIVTILSITLLTVFTGCGKQVKNSDAALKGSVDTILKTGNWSKAQSYAKMALKADINNVDAQIVYAICQDKLGDKEDAIKTLRNIVQGNPGNFMAQLSLGEMLYSSRNYEEAYEYLGNAYNINSYNMNALILYAQCAGKLQTKNTLDLYQKLAQTPQYANKAEVYNNIGAYYLTTKDYSSALKYFLKAYRIDNKDPIIVSNLGILKDDYLNDPKQAKFFYRKFISLTIDNSAFASQREYFSTRLRELRN